MSKQIKLYIFGFFFGSLLLLNSCVYCPPPDLRDVEVKNLTSDSIIVVWIKDKEILASDSILIHNSLFPQDTHGHKIPLEIIPPHSTGTTTIGASKAWLDPIECKCVTFYFIKLASFKQYTWAQLQADTSNHIKTITWYKEDLLEKGKSLVVEN